MAAENEALKEALKAREQEIRDEFNVKFNSVVAKKEKEVELELARARQNEKLALDSASSARKEFLALNEQLQKAELEKNNLEIKMRKELNAQIEEVRKKAKDESDNQSALRIKELELQLTQTTEKMKEAQARAEQGSQQIQGEVLEQEVASQLKQEFFQDIISDVNTGQRGADIIQVVRNNRLAECGIIAWEVKNAQWSDTWLSKLKTDMQAANADVGVIVSRFIGKKYSDIYNVEGKGLIWLVKPQYISAIGHMLRNAFIKVAEAHKGSQITDDKMKAFYEYIKSPTFRNKIESVVKGYDQLKLELEKEKKAAKLRWSKQEKSYEAIMQNILSFYGDLQGIGGKDIEDLLLEGETEN